MSYQVRYWLFNTVIAVPFVVYGVLALWWIVAADGRTSAPIIRGVLVLIPLAVVFCLANYWPTSQRPGHLHHLTTRAASDAATVATHPDGTVTVELHARKDGRGTFFFSRPPRGPVVLYNLRAEPEVCIDLHDIDYAGVQVRRRITGAYRLRGLLGACATIRPYPGDDR